MFLWSGSCWKAHLHHSCVGGVGSCPKAMRLEIKQQKRSIAFFMGALMMDSVKWLQLLHQSFPMETTLEINSHPFTWNQFDQFRFIGENSNNNLWFSLLHKYSVFRLFLQIKSTTKRPFEEIQQKYRLRWEESPYLIDVLMRAGDSDESRLVEMMPYRETIHSFRPY